MYNTVSAVSDVHMNELAYSLIKLIYVSLEL